MSVARIYKRSSARNCSLWGGVESYIMFEDDNGEDVALHEATHKRKRDDFDLPDVPSFPVLARKKSRVEEHDVASGEVAQCADVVSGEAVASAFGGIPEDSGNSGNGNDSVNALDEDEQTFMLPGDELSSEDEEDDLEEPQSASGHDDPCPCCELATSEVVRAMDSVADTLAGRAGDGHITKMQLEIYNRRMAPLRREGRDVPQLTREILLRHYRTHRVSIMRSVAEEIRVFELMERTLRRTGLCDLDADGRRVLVKSGAQEMNRLSKSKLDLLKFYATLEKQRREDEANASSK